MAVWGQLSTTELPVSENIPVSKYSIEAAKQPGFKVAEGLDNGMVIWGVTSFKQRLKQFLQ